MSPVGMGASPWQDHNGNRPDIKKRVQKTSAEQAQADEWMTAFKKSPGDANGG